MPIENFESHSLLPDLVQRGGVAIDCGANLGAFSKLMIDRFNCQMFAFEASPETFARLPRMPGLTARNVAVCGQDGPVRLAVDPDITRTAIAAGASDNDTGRTIEVSGRTLPALISELGITGEIEVLKLDIEGAELGVIDGMSDKLLGRIGQITIEFHDFLGYHTTAEVEQRTARIAGLGFKERYWSRTRNTGDVLLVNGRRIGSLRAALEQGVVRPIRAAGRVLARTWVA